jgi:DMATS type aromatic prenyltransferase
MLAARTHDLALDDGRGLRALAARKLQGLSEGLALDAREAALVTEVFAKLTAGWLDGVPGDAPAWPSDITDDHSPFEFSVSMQGEQRLIRMLVEAQDGDMHRHRGWAPGLRLCARLGREPGVDLGRLRRILDLFAPRPGQGARFSLWHAAEVAVGRPTLYKVYLNPQARGPEAAAALVREALARLGLADAWPEVAGLLALAGSRNELSYFALDLEAGVEARAKVYVGHHGVRAAALERQLAAFAGYQRGDATWLLQRLTGSDGPFSERPVLTCLGFSSRSPDPAVTLHVPVRCYARDDDQVVARVDDMLAGSQGGRFAAAVARFAGRPLEAGRGLVTYLSLRRSPDRQRRLVAYLSPEVYRVQPPAAPPHTLLAVQQRVAARQAELGRHPFIQRLAGAAPVETEALARGLTFFVMAFQDVLRLCARLVTDERLQPLARTHASEDAGHEQWFLHDLRCLGVEASLAFVFSAAHQVPREVGYALVAEVMRASDDSQRLAVVMALEAAGHAFFAPAVVQFERRRPGAQLRYFARQHQQVEQDHELFEAGVQQLLASVALTPEALARAQATVDRAFTHMRRLADDLLARIEPAPAFARDAAGDRGRLDDPGAGAALPR